MTLCRRTFAYVGTRSTFSCYCLHRVGIMFNWPGELAASLGGLLFVADKG
jgi:hypothetical protein